MQTANNVKWIPGSGKGSRFSDAPGKQVLMTEPVDQGADWKWKGKSKGIEMGIRADAIVIFFTVLPPHPSCLSIPHQPLVRLYLSCLHLAGNYLPAGFPPHHTLWLWREPYFRGCLIFTCLNTELGWFIPRTPHCGASFSFPFHFLTCFQLPF